MIHQQRGFLGGVVGATWLSLTLATASAWAQPEEAEAPDQPTPGAEGEAGAEAPKPDEAEGAAPAASEAEPEAAGETDDTAAAPEQKVEAGGTATAEAEAAPASSPAADSSSKVSVELLSAEAFPVYKTRGIPGGSLELDMHGMQWPYLPAEQGGSSFRVGFSGSAWADTSYQKVDAESDADVDLTQWIQQSRLVLRFTPTYSVDGGWFLQGQGEAVLNGNQNDTQPFVADADDIYVKAGKWHLADLQVGRFQGWEIVHYGMGLDLNTFERRGATTDNNPAVQIYGASYMWDRPSGAGNAAVHVYPLEFLRFEVLGQVGSTSGSNIMGVRPVGIVDFGFLKLKGGVEYQKFSSRETGSPLESKQMGAAGSAQFILDPWVELGASFAGFRTDAIDRNGDTDLGRTTDGRTYGGFLNVHPFGELVLGGGLFYTRSVNLQWVDRTGAGEERTHLQAYGAIQYRLFGQLYIKSVTAYGKAHFTLSSPPSYETKAISERLRLMLLF